MMLLYDSEEWTAERLQKATDAICRIYDKEIGIPYYPFQIRMITSDQMMDTYITHGLPFGYAHWSYGKRFAQLKREYDRGSIRLALELVINSDPCILYCIEENTTTANAMVIAHAGCGHNAFFANNYLFKQWTNPQGIVEYAAFAERYIAACEAEHGYNAVEKVLDAAHSLIPHGVHHYTHPKKFSLDDERKRLHKRLAEQERMHNVLMPQPMPPPEVSAPKKGTLDEPMENVLYFIEKNAPMLPTWKREIIRIVYVLAQYFYSQRLTKNINEGFATAVHYHVMGRLYEEKLITDASFERFLRLHTNIIMQPDFDVPDFRGINPYAVSFATFQDIKRMCTNPTEEDRKWFSGMVKRPWKDVWKDAVEMCRDDSFFLHHLSPQTIRDYRLFSIIGDFTHDHVLVTAIHRDDGYQDVRRTFAEQYEPNRLVPLIEVTGFDVLGDRTIEMRHREIGGRTLDEADVVQTLAHAETLWEFPAELKAINGAGDVTYHARVMNGSPSYYVKYRQ